MSTPDGPMTRPATLRRAGLVGAAFAAAATGLAVIQPVAAIGPIAAGAALARGAFGRNSTIFGRVPCRGSAPGAAALTFDDGPGLSTGAVLDALREADARATFFVLGRQAERHPDLVRRIVAEGHQLASHGFDHGILVFRRGEHLERQLRRTEEAVASAVGPDALTPLFRAPHGFRGPLTVRTARALGYRTVGWTTGVFDSADPGAEVIASRCADALSPGVVLLLHDADGWAPDRSRAQTAAAIADICRAARARGLALVRLDELALT